MKKNRDHDIVVTGIGIVSAGAADAERLWELAQKGESPAKVQDFPGNEGMPPLAVCAVSESLDGIPGKRRAHRRDRCTQLALLAASRAWANAGFTVGANPDGKRIGVVVGSSRGPVRKWVEACNLEEKKVLPSLAAESTFACLHGSVAGMLGASGIAYTVSTACSSSAYAIALAAEHLATGAVDVAVAGGADSPLHGAIARQFLSAGILDPSLPPSPVCRPFDKTAQGTVLGEAAGFLILEKRGSAMRRNAEILGELGGWGLAGDCGAESAESAGFGALDGAFQTALSTAGETVANIAYLNMHGTGTRLNDTKEMQWATALEQVRKNPLPCGSTKAVTGHCLGATPVLEAVLCLLAMKKKTAPPSANCSDPAECAPAGLIVGESLPLGEGVAVSNSFGFWGSGASLLFRATDG